MNCESEFILQTDTALPPRKGTGNIAVTTYDIAQKAGVSQATVSRVLNGSSSVNPETKQKVMEWVRKLEYRPNRIARSLSRKRKRSDLLSVIIPDMDNPYFTVALKALEQAADLNGYNILLCDSRGNLQTVMIPWASPWADMICPVGAQSVMSYTETFEHLLICRYLA